MGDEKASDVKLVELRKLRSAGVEMLFAGHFGIGNMRIDRCHATHVVAANRTHPRSFSAPLRHLDLQEVDCNVQCAVLGKKATYHRHRSYMTSTDTFYEESLILAKTYQAFRA